MQRQRRCYNPLPAPAIWTQGVPGETRPLGRRRRTSVERISLPTSSLLTHLVENNYLPLSRLPPPTRRRTRITSKEVCGTKRADKDRVRAMNLLQRVSTSAPSRRSWKISPKSRATTVNGRDITPPSIPRDQKTSVGLGNLHANDWDQRGDGWHCRGYWICQS